MLYLDTNIFFYASSKESLYFSECGRLLKEIVDGKVAATTSTETIQEIMHYYRSLKQDHIGLDICEGIIGTIPKLLSPSQEVIYLYLRLFPKYPKPQSRDLLHLATCVTYGIKTIVTFDREFKKFSEVKAISPSGLS